MNDVIAHHSEKITDLAMSGADPENIKTAIQESIVAIDENRQKDSQAH